MLSGTTVNLSVIRQRLSPERLGRFEADTRDLRAALDLYEWNMDASAAFHGLLHVVEVVLRNAIHDQMTIWHASGQLPGTWFDDPLSLFEPRMTKHVNQARERIRDQGRLVTPGRLVSELTFGFWRYLLASRYETTLWTPAIRHAFPLLASRRRKDIHRRVEQLNHLRNRIAHYEPIYPRRLELDQRDAAFVVSAICAESGAWLEQTSLVTGTLRRRPAI